MSGIDISVVVTLHREGKYLPRTLLSLSEAAVFARQASLSLECIAVFDRSDAATRDAFANTPFERMAAVRTIEADNGCVSRSRNDGCAAARGKYTFILDGVTSYHIRFSPKFTTTLSAWAPMCC